MKKHAVVTGGTKGIGLATSQKLLEKGFRVSVVARNTTPFALAGHPDVTTLTADLARPEAVGPLVAELGSVDVLVNNAGVMHSVPFDAYPDDARRGLMALNLEAPIALMTSLAESLCACRGRVVNVASIAGQIGHPDIWYGVSKAGLINATKSFARLLGGRGVTVNAVAPGPTETDMLATIPEARRVAVKGATYSGRFASAEEVGDVIVWLAVDAPEYVNGFCVDLNNGFFPR